MRLITARSTGAAALAAVLAISAAQARELTYGSYVSPTHTTNRAGLTPFAERVKAQTNGEVSFEIFSGGAMGGPKELLKATRDSVLDASGIVDIYYKSELPVSSMISGMIIMADDPLVYSASMNEFQLLRCPACKQEWADSNIIGLAFNSTDTYHLLCTEAIHTKAEVQGKKVRATSSVGTMMQDMGAVPVSITSAEIYEAMQRGQVACSVGSAAWLDTYNLKDFVKSIVSTPMGAYFGTNTLAMNIDSWDELTDEQKAVFRDNLAEMVADISFAYVAEGRSAIEDARSRGVDVQEADEAMKADIEKSREALYAQTVKDAEAAGVTDAQAIMDEWRATIAKWREIVAEAGGDKEKYREALQREIFSKL